MARTQVAIIGAGPAGLVLAHLLHLQGVESVVLEARDRDYVESRVRAGVLEQPTVDLLRETGVGGRLDREGLVHEGTGLRVDGRTHRIDFRELTGAAITVYGQQEVVKDLIAARLQEGLPLHFEVSRVRIEDHDSDRPRVRFLHDGREQVLEAALVAGCDGDHGISRPTVPDGVLTRHERDYPFAWLGILAETAPASDELVYCRHPDGFALHSMRTPTLTRQYLQVDPATDLADWPDERIWDELEHRFAGPDGFGLDRGPLIDRSVTPMRACVTEPMQHGRLALVGDAAHIVPPTGAKGMNLAVADARVLARAAAALVLDGDEEPWAAYSATCLERVWATQRFSWWMTTMLHPVAGDDFLARVHEAELRHALGSEAAARSLAESYVGLPQAPWCHRG